MPTYNPCMFGVTNFSEGDSDDESGHNGTNFAPYYVSYALVNAGHQQSGKLTLAVLTLPVIIIITVAISLTPKRHILSYDDLRYSTPGGAYRHMTISIWHLSI